MGNATQTVVSVAAVAVNPIGAITHTALTGKPPTPVTAVSPIASVAIEKVQSNRLPTGNTDDDHDVIELIITDLALGLGLYHVGAVLIKDGGCYAIQLVKSDGKGRGSFVSCKTREEARNVIKSGSTPLGSGNTTIQGKRKVTKAVAEIESYTAAYVVDYSLGDTDCQKFLRDLSGFCT
jgi:hypothetical protein